MKKIEFTEEQSQKIIDLYAEHYSCKEIGKEMKCSKQVINKFLKSKNIELRDRYHASQIYNIEENIFEKIDSHEKAYWIGFIAGDGCISSKDNSLVIGLQGSDINHLEKFKEFMKCEHKICTRDLGFKKNGQPKNNCTISITNQKIAKDLSKFNILPRKTYHMDFPQNIPEEFLPSYMLGLIDSDGSFCLKNEKRRNIKTLSFSFVATDEFVLEFQRILVEKCNIKKNKIDKHLKTKYLGVMHSGGYKQIFKIVKYLYENCPIFMHRKKDIAINFLLTKYPNDEWLLKQKVIISI